MRAIRRRLRDETGIGMTELAVAILVLGIILVGLLPIVANSVGLAQGNAYAGQANRILSAHLDAAKTQLASSACAAGSTPLALTGADAGFQAQRVVACDGRLATVTIDVQHRSAPSRTISTATTRVVTAS